MLLRHELANAVIKIIGAKSFLQVGSAHFFDETVCPVKKSVHFESIGDVPAGRLFDVVFVDPPHDPSRALFALNVALEHLAPNGVILVANVNPAEEWMQEVPASAGVQLGQAWRAWLEFRASCGRYTYTADMDHGVGVMVPDPALVRDPARVDFETFARDRAALLNLTDPESVLVALRRIVQRDVVMSVMGAAATAGGAEPVPAEPPAQPAPRRRRRDR